MCGESSHPNAPQASKCVHELMPPYFIEIYHLCDIIKCEYSKLDSFWVPYPQLKPMRLKMISRSHMITIHAWCEMSMMKFHENQACEN